MNSQGLTTASLAEIRKGGGGGGVLLLFAILFLVVGAAEASEAAAVAEGDAASGEAGAVRCSAMQWMRGVRGRG